VHQLPEALHAGGAEDGERQRGIQDRAVRVQRRQCIIILTHLGTGSTYPDILLAHDLGPLTQTCHVPPRTYKRHEPKKKRRQNLSFRRKG
jgi:hypothetical protein